MAIPFDSSFNYDGQPLNSGIANGTTLTIIRQRTAQELGPFQAGTVGVGSNNSVIVDGNWPITSGLNVDDLYTDQYLFRPNATLNSDKVRIVKSYTPLIGQLIPDQSWVNAPTVGEPYELHGVIDPWTVLPTLINQALIRILTVVEFNFSPIAQQNRHSMASVAPWLINPKWVRSVGYLNQGPISAPTTFVNIATSGTYTFNVLSAASAVVGYTAIIDDGNLDGSDFYSVITGINGSVITITDPLPQSFPVGTSVAFQRINESRDVVDPFMRPVRGKCVQLATEQGVITYLEHPAQVFDPSTNRMYVRAIAPAYYFCNGANYPQYGLSLEDDSAPAPADWVAAMTTNEAWRYYAHLLEPIANQRLIRDREAAGAWLSDLSAKYFELPPMEFRPLVRWGSWARNTGPALWGP